jgi:glycosyltransferase involved in cell wall biosynthesis
MRRAAFIVPGPLTTLTGGSVYDRRVIEGLRQRHWAIDVIEIDGEFPHPSLPAIDRTDQCLAKLPDGTPTVIDGLILSVVPDLIARHSQRLPIVGLVHLPLADDRSLNVETARDYASGERRALQRALKVVVTGRKSVARLAQYGLDSTQIDVIEPGTDEMPIARGSLGSGAIRLLCVANVTAGKGHDILLRALARLRDHPWSLECVGSLSRDAATVAHVRAIVRDEELEGRVIFAGELDRDELACAYDRADLFVLATRYETYGMAVAEALAHALPVISTATGAIPHLLSDGAGLLAAPNNERDFWIVLSQALRDESLRSRLRERALRARARMRRWDAVVEQFAQVLESVDAGE